MSALQQIDPEAQDCRVPEVPVAFGGRGDFWRKAAMFHAFEFLDPADSAIDAQYVGHL